MKRFKHSLSHYHLLTAKMGKLYPVGHYEVLPGDTVQQHTSALMRVSPQLAPVMHPVVIRFHTWYVPYRLLWDAWEDFITGGSDGISQVGNMPVVNANATVGFTAKTLPDYFGVKPGSTAKGIQVGAMPFRAYNFIWNKCYRDHDLQSELEVPLTGGNDTTSNLSLQSISWEKDRFTLARPWPQKGPEVTLPLGTRAPVHGIGMANQTYPASFNNASVYETGQSGLQTYATSKKIDSGNDNQAVFVEQDVLNPGFPGIYADLTNATAASIIELREAMGLQRYAEARALYGSEYVDYLRYLGIRPSDARLQRPEYLGGAKQTISWSEIVQLGPDGADEGVGDLRGHGIAAMRTRPYRYFFEEHGICITLMSVRPKTIYGDGLPRMWSRRVKEDFWEKELERIGQEELYRREIYAQSDADGGDTVFGYADRYSDYRSIQSRVSGEFRTSTMYDWHLARLLGAAPTLNSAFITCDPTTRIFADQTADADHLWLMVNHKIAARRMVGRGGVIPTIR